MFDAQEACLKLVAKTCEVLWSKFMKKICNRVYFFTGKYFQLNSNINFMECFGSKPDGETVDKKTPQSLTSSD